MVRTETPSSWTQTGGGEGRLFSWSAVFFGVFAEEQSEGGELDLDGIDDQEIDKVISFINPTTVQ